MAADQRIDGPQVLDALLGELDRTRAAKLARNGDLDEAARVLTTGAAARGPSPANLDLLARVRAQQGRFHDASKCWTRAGELADDGDAYAAPLRRLAELDGRPRPVRRRTAVVLVGLGMVVAAATGFGVGRVDRPPEPGLTLMDLQRSQNELGEAVRDLSAGVGRREEAAADLRTLAGRLETVGLGVRITSSRLDVTFPEGLFEQGATLTPAGAAVLATTGAALAPGKRWVVRVVGHGDDLRITRGRYRDAAELGIARAVAAAQVLSPHSRIPLTAIELATGGAVETPYPNDSAENRSRNRTVTLVILGAAA